MSRSDDGHGVDDDKDNQVDDVEVVDGVEGGTTSHSGRQ